MVIRNMSTFPFLNQTPHNKLLTLLQKLDVKGHYRIKIYVPGMYTNVHQDPV